MPQQFDVVFEKLELILRADVEAGADPNAQASSRELDEIEELRRFAAEMHEPERSSFTTT